MPHIVESHRRCPNPPMKHEYFIPNSLDFRLCNDWQRLQINLVRLMRKVYGMTMSERRFRVNIFLFFCTLYHRIGLIGYKIEIFFLFSRTK